MILPCIDLMEGKVVQLVQGREKALEADSPEEMLRKFAAFPEIQVIDLDAAMGRGSNDDLVRMLASRAVTRVGGGVRSVERAATLVEQGARKVIVGTAAFTPAGIDEPFLRCAGQRRGPRAPGHRARFERRPDRGEGLAGIDRPDRRRGVAAAGAVLLRLPVHLRG